MKVVIMLCLLAGVASAAKTKNNDVFYVYSDKGAIGNHYIPSGWMGDHGDLRFNDNWKENCQDGTSCIQVKYTAEGKQGANWAGIFWQRPANNWGETKDGGYDLSAYKRLTFWARGEKGGETLAEVGLGGITGTYPDSASTRIGPIRLTKEWKQYTVELRDQDLHYIVGGFVFATNRDYNPKGFIIYLDQIALEK